MKKVVCSIVFLMNCLLREVLSNFAPSPNPSRSRNTVNIIYTVAGSSTSSATGTGGVASAMTFKLPKGIWEDSMGVIYTSDSSGQCVRQFSYPNGIVTDVAGMCGTTGAFSGDGGLATSGKLNSPFFLCGNTNGVLYIDDFSNNRIRIVSNQIITTLTGSAASNSGDNGPASSATLSGPAGIWLDTQTRLYIGVQSGHNVRRVDLSTNIITLIAGIRIDLSM